MLQTISIVVSGRVQGVFYRQSTKEKAMDLGITGTVENLPDGNVYIRATGTSEQLDLLVNWCWQGPPRAKVSSVDVNIWPYQSFDSFRIVK
jgi:acylphosphatase